MDVREEQLLTVERDSVRHADVPDVAAGARRVDRLHHRLLRANTFQYRIGTDSISQFLDSRNAFITTFGHNVGRTEFACELLARRVTAHRDDALRAHLFCGEHAEQSDRTVTDHRYCRAGVYIRSIRGEPASTHHIRERQETRD